ncbi:MAG: Gfo/Idh/MocA family oxidoreductase [Planctomycetota bacterium]
MTPTGIGMLGAGAWGRNHVRTLELLPEAELRWICDVDDRVLERYGRSHPAVSRTGSLEDVLSDSQVEAVVIASPAPTHASLTQQALLADRHVLVEKPLALSVAEAEELVQLASERERILMVGHILAYHPGLQALSARLTSGELGELRYLYAQRVNLGRVRAEESALWSLGSHDVSAILQLVGREPVSVSAQGRAYLTPSVEDVVFVHLEFPGGVLAHIHLSWLDPHKVRRLTVVGSQKMAVLDDMETTEKLRIYDRGAERPEGWESYGEAISLRFGDIVIPRLDMEEPLRLECRHFLDCIRTGERPRTDGAEGLAVVRILAAAEESLRAGGVPRPVAGGAR